MVSAIQPQIAIAIQHQITHEGPGLFLITLVGILFQLRQPQNISKTTGFSLESGMQPKRNAQIPILNHSVFLPGSSVSLDEKKSEHKRQAGMRHKEWILKLHRKEGNNCAAVSL